MSEQRWDLDPKVGDRVQVTEYVCADFWLNNPQCTLFQPGRVVEAVNGRSVLLAVAVGCQGFPEWSERHWFHPGEYTFHRNRRAAE